MEIDKHIRAVHVVASLHHKYGGPSRTVPALCQALDQQKLNICLITQMCRDDPPLEKHFNEGKLVSLISSRFHPQWTGIGLTKYLDNLAINKKIDLIHTHGLWDFGNARAAKLAHEYRLPLAIHTRGMLEPWALQHGTFKKRLALHIYQRAALEYASVIFATSEQEYQGIRQVGIKSAVAVIPNGVDFGERSTVTPGFVQNNKKTMLFLSRIHKKKGLVNLVRAWKEIDNKEWQLVIAGPDEGGHLAEIVKLSEYLGCANIIFCGEVSDSDKQSFYYNSDVFVLPTYSENFGVVVAEALTCGLPVITTVGAPWADLEYYKCGWWVKIGQKPLELALRDAMDLDPKVLKSMGDRAKVLGEKFNWPEIARRTKRVYDFLLGGVQPVDLRTD